MVDLNRPLAQLLKPIARVELEFPAIDAAFPVITLTEVANVTNYEVENVECISDITYQVDVWDNGKTRERCEQLSAEVSRVLTANGFTRTLGRGMKDPSGLHRKIMYFKGLFINKEE